MIPVAAIRLQHLLRVADVTAVVAHQLLHAAVILDAEILVLDCSKDYASVAASELLRRQHVCAARLAIAVATRAAVAELCLLL